MAEHAKDLEIWWGDVKFKPLGNSFTFRYQTPRIDTTTFDSSGYEEGKPGSKLITGSISGFVDEVAWGTNIGPTPQTTYRLSVCRRTPVAADIGHSFVAQITSAKVIGDGPDGAVQMAIEWTSSDRYHLRGQWLFAGTSVLADSPVSGTGVNFGTLAATDTLWAVLHSSLKDVAGTTPTLTPTVQRAASDSWGAPTTVYTFTAATDAANNFQTKSTETGVQAETWYRATATLSGTGASFDWALFLAKTAVS